MRSCFCDLRQKVMARQKGTRAPPTFLKMSKSENLSAVSPFPKGFLLFGILAANCLRVYSSKSSCLAGVSCQSQVLMASGNILQSAMRREMLQHGQANVLQGHGARLETFRLEVLFKGESVPTIWAQAALLIGIKRAPGYRDCRQF